MSDPWPEREPYEEDHRYLIRMVRQLFVEMAKVNVKLDKPLYQITMPPTMPDQLTAEELEVMRKAFK